MLRWNVRLTAAAVVILLLGGLAVWQLVGEMALYIPRKGKWKDSAGVEHEPVGTHHMPLQDGDGYEDDMPKGLVFDGH